MFHNVNQMATGLGKGRGDRARRGSLLLLALGLCGQAAIASSPWAGSVAAYEPGSTPFPGLSNPATAVGGPTLYDGGLAVSVFNPTYLPEHIVSGRSRTTRVICLGPT
jgi:hypothetical protein